MTDFSLLDRPQIRGIMFYPSPYRSSPPAGALDLFVSVGVPIGNDVSLHVRIYVGTPDAPTIVLFHGNGEVVADYDEIAELYSRFGLNLAVSDYRGYGHSGGSPSYTAMMADAHAVKAAVLARLNGLGWRGSRLLMGRSLGALSAVELAATDAEGFDGLVMESGAANVRGWTRFAAAGEEAAWEALAVAQRERLETIRLPLLTIHGAEDELIPLDRALEAHEAAGSPVKELLVIPGAGHNDLLAVDAWSYFEALAAFAAQCKPG